MLISRRACYRAGVRYYMRGLDSEGQVANYVETEQILECEGCKGSFVQVIWQLKTEHDPPASQQDSGGECVYLASCIVRVLPEVDLKLLFTK